MDTLLDQVEAGYDLASSISHLIDDLIDGINDIVDVLETNHDDITTGRVVLDDPTFGEALFIAKIALLNATDHLNRVR